MAKNKDETPEDIQITEDAPDHDLPMDEPDTAPESEEDTKVESDEPKSLDTPEEEPKETAAADKSEPKVAGKKNTFMGWIHDHKKLSVLISILIVLVIAAVAVAFTDARFAVMNLFMKASANVTVLDEKSHQPIPNAKVTIDNITGQTDKKGVAQLKNVKFGPQSAKIEKDAYATLQTTVRIESSPQKTSLSLHPTGTPLSFIITNKISGAIIKGAKITFGGSDALTNTQGIATLNVPPQSATDVEVSLSADGFNATLVKVKIDPAAKNAASLTPSGKLYFLSKRTGTINVMSSNLDGTNAVVAIPGTGKENDQTTTLLASRDWKFLALKASRDSDKEKVYLIDTSNNQMATIDEGDASFTSVGWHDHDFVYTVTRNSVQWWQPNKTALKSFNAEAKSLKTIDQTAAEGAQNSYVRQNIDNLYIVKDGIVYTKMWDNYNMPARQGEVTFASVDGKQKKTLKTFDPNIYAVQARAYEAASIYYQAYVSNTPNVNATYFEYEDGAVKTADITEADFNKPYPTYLVSPSSNLTYWNDQRDGKDALLVGDAAGKNGKEVSPLSNFVAYGWYSDDYLLASKDSSELYILPRAGISDPTKALKITDYHKPAINFNGYGYGYGGF